MCIDQVALVLWLNDHPDASKESFGLLSEAGRKDYEARARAVLARAAPDNAPSALTFPMIRISVSKPAATHFVEDMREIGFEPKRDGTHVSFAREGVIDERYSALVTDAGSQIYVRPDPRPL